MREGHGDARFVAEPLTSKQTRAWPLASPTMRAPGSLSPSTAGFQAPSTTKPSRQRCTTAETLFGIEIASSPECPAWIANPTAPEITSNSELHRHRDSAASSPNQCRKRCLEPTELRQRNPPSRARWPSQTKNPGFSSVTKASMPILSMSERLRQSRHPLRPRRLACPGGRIR